VSWKLTDQWVAGFFDGEGCVSIVRRKRGNWIEHHLSVQISQNDQRPLKAIRKRFGGSQCVSMTPSGCWRWRIHGKAADAFLRAIHPFSIVKAEQIRLALVLRSFVGSPSRRSTPELWRKKEAAWKRFRKAKEKR
jgi:hypothetical protein